MLACDGVFDKLNSSEAISVCWQNIFQDESIVREEQKDPHKSCGLAVDGLIKASALRKSCDNLTAVVIAFDGFETSLNSIKDPDKTFSEGNIVESEIPSIWGKAVFTSGNDKEILDPEDYQLSQ